MAQITQPASLATTDRRVYDVRLQIVVTDQRLALGLLGLLLGASVLVAFLSKSTYDSGDGIFHYLIARYVPQHPDNLLNPWAKPFFTLLATLPAQGGYLGMKLFQCGVVALSAWLAFVVARALKLPFPFLAVVFCYAAPDYFRIQLSGLTEPLFGLVLIGSVALAASRRPGWSAALVTWLPFVRSEGFILLGIWVVYLLWNRSWRVLPLLGLGYAVYSVVGGWLLGDYGWVFGGNPYGLHSQYGSGRWTHFLEHLPTLLGWGLLALFVLGGLNIVWRMFRKATWAQPLFRVDLLLVYGSIVVFVAAHSIFWALGLFGSFGMTRVLTVLTPLFAVAAVRGLAWASQLTPRPAVRRWLAVGTVAGLVVLLFGPDRGFSTDNGGFMGHHSTLHWRRDLQQSTDLALADEAVAWFKQHEPNWRWHPIAFEHTYYAAALDADLFDPAIRVPLTKNWQPDLDAVPVGTYIFWDGWFCPVEGHLPLAMLQKDGRFKQLWRGTIPMDRGNPTGETYKAVILQKVR